MLAACPPGWEAAGLVVGVLSTTHRFGSGVPIAVVAPGGSGGGGSGGWLDAV